MLLLDIITLYLQIWFCGELIYLFDITDLPKNKIILSLYKKNILLPPVSLVFLRGSEMSVGVSHKK